MGGVWVWVVLSVDVDQVGLLEELLEAAHLSRRAAGLPAVFGAMRRARVSVREKRRGVECRCRMRARLTFRAYETERASRQGD